MKRRLQASRLQYALRHKNGYLILAMGSIILNSLLVLYCFSLSGHERIILMPPLGTTSFWVDGNQVSKEYLSDMAIYFIGLRLNATQENVKTQHERLLRYVHPSFYAPFKAQLMNEEERIKNSHLTMVFYFAHVDADTNKMTAAITGDLQYFIGQEIQPLKRVQYKIAFNYAGDRLLVKSFQEVKDHA